MRYLSGSRRGTIKAYFAAHPEVANYEKGYGLIIQHDRGKIPITEVIEWWGLDSVGEQTWPN